MGTSGRSAGGDAVVDAFVDANIISFAAWDLVAYLSQHPSDSCDLGQFAHLLSRAEDDVALVLRRLTDNGVLVQTYENEHATYRLADDSEIRDVVARFVSLSTKREQRLDYVRRVLGQVTSP